MPNLQELQLDLKDYYSPEEIKLFHSYLKSLNNVPEKYIERLKAGEPIQYVCEQSYFYYREFKVNNNVLIPRPETEELCEIIITNEGSKKAKLLEIGTGSGCISVTLSLECKHFEIMATDISEAALQIARFNADHFGCRPINFQKHDFLSGEALPSHFDIIVSNPPYISLSELHNMSKSVVDFEPNIALFPKGNDPLIFYKELSKLLETQHNECVLYAEINQYLAEETMNIFDTFSNKTLIKDISGNARFIKIKKEG